MSRADYLVRSEVIAGFDGLVRELGGDPTPMYRKVGLSAALMSNADHMIPCSKVSTLLDIASKTLDRRDFGILLASQRKVFQIGILWNLISQSPSVEQALKAATKHLHLHNRAVMWQLAIEGDHASLTRADRLSSEVPTFQWAVYSTCSMVAGLRVLCGNDWRPSSVSFIHSPPDDRGIYDRYFGVKVEFNRDFNLIHFPASALKENLSRGNGSLYRQVNKQIQAMEAEYDSLEDFGSKIKLLIEQRLFTASCTQNEIAEALSMHPKALQRELRSRGMTFRELRAEVRLDTAERYLRDSEISLTTIADILGFSDLSSFSHAFKNRHQISAAEWRKKARE